MPSIETLLHGLDDAQREAVVSDATPLCIVAGAGSGKTRVLTRRVAYRLATEDADARHTITLTFTRKAGDELRTRIRHLVPGAELAAGTFHSLAYAQLRLHWADRGDRAPALLEKRGRVLGRVLPRVLGQPASQSQFAELVGEIDWAKARMVSPADYIDSARKQGRTPLMSLDRVSAIYAEYEREKTKRGLFDFDDLLVRCAALLESDAEFSAAQRWRFRHFFVDELQDLNPAQLRLLRAWLGQREDLCVVGDPHQAIYGWNGADSSFLTDFRSHYPTAAVVHLERNYRSVPEVLKAARAILTPLTNRPLLQPVRPEGDQPAVRSFPDEKAEAAGIARFFRQRHGSGIRWADMAVLTRTNAQLLTIEEALRNSQIPYRASAGRFLVQPDIKDAIATLKRNSSRLLRSALPDLDELRTGDGDVERELRLDEMIRLSHELLAIEADASVTTFLQWLPTVIDEKAGQDSDAVELTTFHRSKGLEWSVVCLAGMEAGLVPIRQASTDAALDEERRLMYVAVTRARDNLMLSWAERRTFGTNTMTRSPSPFLDEMASAISGAPAVTEKTRNWKDGISESRNRLAATRRRARRDESPEDPLATELRKWRSSSAKAAQVPAYVIFNDATLDALVETRPTNEIQLLQTPGLGQVKVARFGESILEIVKKHPVPSGS